MITLERGFKNNDGEVYKNINDVHLSEMSDLRSIGEFFKESRIDNKSDSFSEYDVGDGSYIYLDKENTNRAFRIYKDYADYKYVYHSDDRFVSKLQERQNLVKLTDFPTGIVSLENYVIGQEIVFYKDYQTLFNSLMYLNKEEILDYYIKIIDILNELSVNGIIYKDVHAKNFMVDITNKFIKLIDFEEGFVSFDVKYSYKYMLKNLKEMLNKINEIYNINLDDSKIDNLNDLKYNYLEYKLKKK